MLFGCIMHELSNDVCKGLVTVRTAMDDARRSLAFRAVLRHTARLGSIVNFGKQSENIDVAGFTLDALPRLALFKAASNSKINLLHVLVVQVSNADPALLDNLLADFSDV